MPSVVNGCGTWYHFKSNRQYIQAVCPHCGQHAQLTSYDTWLFVVIVFIPVIPLGRKRIVNECSACTRHMAIPLQTYRKIIERAQAAQRALEASPKDPKLAREALAGCVPVRDVQQFLAVAPTIETHQGSEPESLRLLAAAYEVFGRISDGERVLRLALAAKDEAATREQLANNLLDQGKVEEAEPYLAHIRELVIPDRVTLLYRAAQQYQIKGNHAKAMEYFQACTEVLPSLEQDELFRKLRDASQQAMGTGKAIKPAEIAKKMQNRASLKKLGRFAAAAAVLIAIGYLVLCWYLGRNHRLYLANGLDRNYQAAVDGKMYTLAPFSTATANVSEGRHTLTVNGLKQPLEEQSFVISSSFLARPFAAPVFILNPDCCAIIVRETVSYGSSSNHSEHEAGHAFHAGELLTREQGVDFPFQPFPRSIRVQEGSDLRRTRLGVYGDDGRLDRARILAMVPKGQVPQDRLVEIAWRKVDLEGTGETNLGLAMGLSGVKRSAEILRKGIGRRPVDLQWHRYYQEAAEALGQNAEVEREYDALLAANPQDATLQYLAGRCCSDGEKSRKLLEASAAAAAPCPNALSALAWRELAAGEFRNALAWLDRADAYRDRLPGLERMRAECLAGLGQYAQALELTRQVERQAFPACLESLREQIPLYAAMDDAEGGRACIDRIMGQIAPKGTEFRQEYDPQLLGALDYCLGRMDAYTKAFQGSKDEGSRFAVAVSDGDLDSARKSLNAPEKDEFGYRDVSRPLLMYIAASKVGNQATAAEYLAKARETMARTGGRYGVFVRAFDGGVGWEEVRTAGLDVDAKRTVLVALGLARPELRTQCFALAKKLNYDRRFPHHLIREVTAQEAQ